MKQNLIKSIFLALLTIALSPNCRGAVTREEVLTQQSVPVYTYRVIRTYAHDITSFTQGLFLDDKFLYEGTGLYGQSKLLKIDLNTAGVLKQHNLDSRYFGEGITIFADKVFQLTLNSNIGFVYDQDSLEPIRTFRFSTQGWGLTTDGKDLIISNGTAELLFLDPDSFEQTGSIVVSADNQPLDSLNELEYINGEIYANVWKTDLIAIISPQTGKVSGWIDLTGLNPDETSLKRGNVLNGIAYDKNSGRLLVTGKRWAKIYEIELVPLKHSPSQN